LCQFVVPHSKQEAADSILSIVLRARLGTNFGHFIPANVPMLTGPKESNHCCSVLASSISLDEPRYRRHLLRSNLGLPIVAISRRSRRLRWSRCFRRFWWLWRSGRPRSLWRLGTTWFFTKLPRHKDDLPSIQDIPKMPGTRVHPPSSGRLVFRFSLVHPRFTSRLSVIVSVIMSRV